MAWQIEFAATAKRQLTKIGKSDAKRITKYLRDRIASSENPRAIGKPLKGVLGDLWRYRVGDYRVLCDIQDNRLVILVVAIGHRREVYR